MISFIKRNSPYLLAFGGGALMTATPSGIFTAGLCMGIYACIQLLKENTDAL